MLFWMKNKLVILFNIDDGCLEFDKNIHDYKKILKAAANQDKHCFKDYNLLITLENKFWR